MLRRTKYNLPNLSEELKLQGLLSKCDSLEQMLQVLLDRYDLANCKPGIVGKPTLIKGLISAYKLTKPKLKDGNS